MKKIAFLLCSLLIMLTVRLNSQVTIGMDMCPVEGALLDLKSFFQESSNTTASKGLQLPRVELTDVHLLQPMYTDNKDAEDIQNKMKHIGLLVYNITENTEKLLVPGLYVWDGEKWRRVLLPL